MELFGCVVSWLLSGAVAVSANKPTRSDGWLFDDDQILSQRGINPAVNPPIRHGHLATSFFEQVMTDRCFVFQPAGDHEVQPMTSPKKRDQGGARCLHRVASTKPKLSSPPRGTNQYPVVPSKPLERHSSRTDSETLASCSLLRSLSIGQTKSVLSDSLGRFQNIERTAPSLLIQDCQGEWRQVILRRHHVGRARSACSPWT